MAKTIVAKPLSNFVLVDVEEERRKIFNPGKVFVPVEQIDFSGELFFGKVNWKALEAIVGPTVNRNRQVQRLLDLGNISWLDWVI